MIAILLNALGMCLFGLGCIAVAVPIAYIQLANESDDDWHKKYFAVGILFMIVGSLLVSYY